MLKIHLEINNINNREFKDNLNDNYREKLDFNDDTRN